MKYTAWKRLCASLCALMLLVGASACAEEDALSVIVPDGYVQGSGLPIYSAAVRDQNGNNFFDQIEVEWFNLSGVASYENWSKRARYDHYTFEDEAVLNIDVEYVSYEENDGTFMQILGEKPDELDGPYPRESFACAIGELGSLAYFYGRQHEDQYGFSAISFEKDELGGITLASAEARVQELLSKIGLTDYKLSFALDMSVEHIRALGECEQKYHENFYNKRAEDDQWDFSAATEADEGYYLRLVKTINGLEVWLPDGGDFSASAFVNADGIRSFTLRDYYEIGEVYETPEALLTAEEAFEKFEQGNAKRIADGFLDPTLIGAELRYIPKRAENKADGMVLVPAWYITYTFIDGKAEPGWAWYSAVDGTLVQDCYSF